MSTKETSLKPSRTPHRVETERLVLRCYEPADSQALQVVCAANREHLLPRLAWAEADPQTLDEKLDLVLTFRSNYDSEVNCVMGIFHAETGDLLGGTGFHPGSGHDFTKIREIGYWVAQSHEGQGYITEAVKALLVVAFKVLALQNVIIRCEPDNTRSLAIPERLGFVNEGLLRCAVPREDVYEPAYRYSMLASEYESSDACQEWARDPSRVRCFDALGRLVPRSL
jgi:ribosomal-protein-serine acetyltransferase